MNYISIFDKNIFFISYVPILLLSCSLFEPNLKGILIVSSKQQTVGLTFIKNAKLNVEKNTTTNQFATTYVKKIISILIIFITKFINYTKSLFSPTT